jgi:carbamoyltransferase
MLILGIFTGGHDANAALFDDYRMVAAVQLERMTRIKTDGGRIPQEAIDECLLISGVTRTEVDVVMLGRGNYPAQYYSHLPWDRALEDKLRRAVGREKHKSMEREMVRYGRSESAPMFRAEKFLAEEGFRADATLRFFNHHEAHALPCLFHTDWDDALLYTADGGGDNVQYSHRIFRANGQGGDIDTLYGGDEAFLTPERADSVGVAYAMATRSLGFTPNRHEGKLTGLAAWGEPEISDLIAAHFSVTDQGQVLTDFPDRRTMREGLLALFEGHGRETVAASIQHFLEETMLVSVGRLLEKAGSRRLGVSGGVFANVRLNQRLAEELPVDEIFIYPAMSDAGLAAGGALRFLLERDGLDVWLANRWRFDALSYGRDYGDGIDTCLSGHTDVQAVAGDHVEESARLLEAGAIVAIFSQGMEYGPRALGARTIMASPADAGVNDRLNTRLARTEFMPFAPVIAEEDADTVFDLGPVNSYAARFMTITCGVRDGWRERIPAVVHVDGTARPQTIRRDTNPTYYDVLAAFKARTGLPTLVNTSFNVHEEPIVNRPEECLQALLDRRVDYVVTDRGLYGLKETVQAAAG